MKTSEITASLVRKLRGDRYICATEFKVLDGDLGRADVVAMLRSGHRTALSIFEVKVSRSDFLADTKAGKWRRYTAAGPVWFAVPAGLVEKSEVPDGAGLMTLDGRGWRRVKRADDKMKPPPVETMRRLVMAVADQTRAAANAREANRWRLAEGKRRELADAIRGALAREDHELWVAKAAEEFAKFSDLQNKVRNLEYRERRFNPMGLPIEPPPSYPWHRVSA